MDGSAHKGHLPKPFERASASSHREDYVWRGHDRNLARHLGPWIATFSPAGDNALRLSVDDLAATTFLKRPIRPLLPPDSSLNAFAQVGALRLRAERVVISLVGRREHHVIAEATSTSALDRHPGHAEDDSLWLGRCVLPTAATVEGVLVAHWLVEMGKGWMAAGAEFTTDDNASEGSPAPSPFFAEDLLSHDAFKDLPLLKTSPDNKGFIGVPVIATSGQIIGVFALYGCIAQQLDRGEIQFLQDISKTVSTYIANISKKVMQTRAERLVRGIALFMEGKSSLRQWFLEEGYKDRVDLAHGHGRDTFAISNEANDVYGPQHFANATTRRQSPHSPLGGQNAISHSQASRSARSPTLDSVTLNEDDSDGPNRAHADRPPSKRGRLSVDYVLHPPPSPPGSEDVNLSSDDLISKDMSSLFSRAANLMREACQFDGVLIYDASTSGDAVANAGSAAGKSVDTSNSEHTSNESGEEVQASTTRFGALDSRDCPILGFSMTAKSSLVGNLASQTHRQFKRWALQRLIKKHSHGRIFRFQDGEPLSSADLSTEPDLQPMSPATGRGRKYRNHKYMKQITAQDVNSVVFFPLWDWYRNRWFAGIIAWTSSPTRLIDFTEEVLYLKAFGNSLMMELARIDASTSDRAKAKFISSISHELRSPLHGILAGTEILEGFGLQGFANSVIATIDSCGKTLLETIDHLLTFSEINSSRAISHARTQTQSNRSTKSGRISAHHPLSKIAKEALDPVLALEEVLETIFFGRFHISETTKNGIKDGSTEPIVDQYLRVPYIVLDSDYVNRREFFMVGAVWRRIVLNLVNNALKFTEEGYFHIQVHIQRQHNRVKHSDSTHILVLQIEDTGKGIDQEFLRHRLFDAFAQEDIMSNGVGLGLHMTRQLIEDLDGSIKVESTVGKGSHFTVRLPLEIVSEPTNFSQEYVNRESFRESTRGLSVCLVSHLNADKDQKSSVGRSLVFQSLSKLFTGWFHMDILHSTTLHEASGNFIVMIDEDFRSQFDSDPRLELEATRREIVQSSALLVLCYNLRFAANAAKRFPLVQFVTPPFGTRSIAKALQTHLESIHPNDNQPTQWQPNRISFGAVTASSPASEPDFAISKSPPTSPTTSDNQGSAKEKTLATVLLVEDNEINMKFLVAFARRHDLNYICANNGLEALEAYKKRTDKFTVIFMDISMPVMDGLTATREIRRFENEFKLPRTYIVALTGVSSETAQQDAYNAGIDLFLSKPAQLKRLKIVMDQVTAGGVTK